MSLVDARIYFTDAYCDDFEAQIVDRFEVDGRPAVVLDETAFYPTSGGQPHDLGMINDVAVVDVFVDEQERVVHVLAEPLDKETSNVFGEIDWERRVNFMQHHTGQHILSRAFEMILNAETVGFHLTEANATIDLNVSEVAQKDLNRVEDMTNLIIRQGLPVEISFPSTEQLSRLSLRKVSDKIKNEVRVISIGAFDVCACGGTHVEQTSEVGLLSILATERIRQQVRVTFACGQRALEDYRAKNIFLNDIAARYTMSYIDIPANIDKLREENKLLQKRLKATRESLMQFQAQELWGSAAQQSSSSTIVSAVFNSDDMSAADLQILARLLAAKPQTVALLGIYGEQSHLVFACSSDNDLDVVPYLKRALGSLGSSRGGGRPNMAQGGGFAASEPDVQQAINEVRRDLA